MRSVIFALCMIFILSISIPSFGHQLGAHFSGAISEPTVVHHAHIEDEQSLNLSFNDGFRKEENDKKRFAFESSLELATSWNDDFSFGSEIFIPFSTTGNADDRYALGDIELWPIKYAFINQAERVLTAALSIGLPTGSEKYGFGEGQTTLGALFFLDQAWRNWFFGVNAEFETVISGPTETEIELAFALTYSFIEGTGDGVAPTIPSQSIVPVLSLEMVSENILSGLEKENDLTTVILSVNLWNPKSDWLVTLGAEVPISSYRENDFKIHFKLRNHFDWGKLLR